MAKKKKVVSPDDVVTLSITVPVSWALALDEHAERDVGAAVKMSASRADKVRDYIKPHIQDDAVRIYQDLKSRFAQQKKEES